MLITLFTKKLTESRPSDFLGPNMRSQKLSRKCSQFLKVKFLKLLIRIAIMVKKNVAYSEASNIPDFKGIQYMKSEVVISFTK